MKCYGSHLYLVGYRTDSHEYEQDASPCLLCRKMIINAGIEKVYVRVDKNTYIEILVDNWIQNDELLNGQTEY